MNRLYNTGIALYGALARLASLGSEKVKRMLKGQTRTIERLRRFRSELAPGGFDVWFHAASLGEFEQARPLIEELILRNPQISILLSFFSPSGYEVRHDFHPRVAVVYLPFDNPGNVSAFLDVAEPKMAIFVKYEFWGNYLTELKRRGIPTFIISAIFRPGQIFFRPWGGTFRDILRCFDRLYVQDESSRELLSGVGIDKVTVAGDTRFDRVTTIRSAARPLPLIETFKAAHPDAFTLVVGSSWPADEDIYIPWLKEHPDTVAIIAPHEFDSQRLLALRNKLGKGTSMLLSDFQRLYDSNSNKALRIAEDFRFLIIDCFGLLSSLYRYADVAYVGGGFGAGIHNINEAAVYGIPVIFGPNHKKFNEARDMIAAGAAFEVKNISTLKSSLDRLAADALLRRSAGEAADRYIRSHIGATPRIMNDLFDESGNIKN